MNTPVLVHVYTKKGKGSGSAELDSEKYYSVSESNKIIKKEGFSYSKVVIVESGIPFWMNVSMLFDHKLVIN